MCTARLLTISHSAWGGLPHMQTASGCKPLPEADPLWMQRHPDAVLTSVNVNVFRRLKITMEIIAPTCYVTTPTERSVCSTIREVSHTSVHMSVCLYSKVGMFYVCLSVQWRIQGAGWCLAPLCQIIGWCTLSGISAPWKMLDLPLLSVCSIVLEDNSKSVCLSVCLSVSVVLHQNKMLPLAHQTHISSLKIYILGIWMYCFLCPPQLKQHIVGRSHGVTRTALYSAIH